MRYFKRLLEAVAAVEGIDMTMPFKQLSEKHQQLILDGTGDRPFKVSYQNRFGRRRRYETPTKVPSPGWSAVTAMPRATAPASGTASTCGKFLRQLRWGPAQSRFARGDRGRASTSTNCRRSRCGGFPSSSVPSGSDERDATIAAAVVKEIKARIDFLVDVGLDYLTLMRSAATLAGGEAQRIRLATQIGSGLVGVLYILDEPSIGLHQRDNQRLIETLLRSARPRQHADRRRTRRGDDAGRRPRRRHRPRSGPMSTMWSATRIVSSSSTTINVLPRSRNRMSVSNQTLVVAVMKADGRLVEDVEHANEPRANLRRQTDPLCFTTRERRCRTHQGEVVEPDVDEEVETSVGSP